MMHCVDGALVSSLRMSRNDASEFVVALKIAAFDVF